MNDIQERVGEVIEASTGQFTAQSYELYHVPPFGSLVRTQNGDIGVYGVVGSSTTSSIDPGRKPIARGQDEANEEDVYRSSPQLAQLLRSEFTVVVIGHRTAHGIYQYLPPAPARIHGFVYQCGEEEIREFSESLDFLSILLNARLDVSTEELIPACLRRMSQVYTETRHGFLVGAGKELAVLLSGEFNRLNAILKRMKE